MAQNFNSVAHRAPLAPTQPSYWALRSTWAISQIPWDSRIQPDISIELKMDSCAPPPPLSFPSCFPSLIVCYPLASLPRQTRSSKIPHRFSRPGGSLHIQSLTPASLFRPIHGGGGGGREGLQRSRRGALEGCNRRRGWGSARRSRVEEGRPGPQG